MDNEPLIIDLGEVKLSITKKAVDASRYVYTLPENFFELRNKTVKAMAMDTEQIALFADYLRDFGVVGKYDDTALSTLFHYLTGWSAKCIKEELSLNFRDIKRFKHNKPSTQNLQVIKSILIDIVQKVDRDIVEAENYNKTAKK